MDLDFNEEQNIISKTAKDFLRKECPSSFVREMREDEQGCTDDFWNKMGELGWMGVIIPQEYDGIGGNFMDLAIILEAMGEVSAPGPFFSTVVIGAQAILMAGSEDQKKKLLPLIANGRLVLAYAIGEPGNWYGSSNITTTATENEDSYTITGTKLFVENAHIADHIICVTKTNDGLTMFLVDGNTPGLTITQLSTFGYDKQCEVIFDEVKVPKENIIGQIGQAEAVLEKIEQQAAVAKCAEMLGAIQVAFSMTVDYAKQREQFGVAIGSFQAIQHFCANMAVDVDSTRFITYEAAWKIGQGLPASAEAAMAKAWTSEAANRVTRFAHQVHGAVSFCDEHDLHLYYRKVKAASIAHGDADYHLEKVAQHLGL